MSERKIRMMKSILLGSMISMVGIGFSPAGVEVCEDTFGESLGGWKKRDKQTAEYALSGSMYRTYRPEITTTPEGGIFISVRLDHIRGWLSSDDHAMLEVTVSPQGIITSAKSNIAIQGQSIVSDVILGTNEAGKEITGANQAVQIGTDLVSNLTAKLLRENLVEAGRVSFPAAIRHNYNHLYQALVVDGVRVSPVQSKVPVDAAQKPEMRSDVADAMKDATAVESSDEPDPPVAKPVPENAELEVQPFPGSPVAEMPAAPDSDQ